jgi:hypothetical protein
LSHGPVIMIGLNKFLPQKFSRSFSWVHTFTNWYYQRGKVGLLWNYTIFSCITTHSVVRLVCILRNPRHTEQVGLYSGGACFESRPLHRLHLTEDYRFPHSGYVNPRVVPELSYDCFFQVLSNSSFINHATFWENIVTCKKIGLTNNNGLWIWWLGLLALHYNYNKLWQLIISDCFFHCDESRTKKSSHIELPYELRLSDESRWRISDWSLSLSLISHYPQIHELTPFSKCDAARI